MTVPERSPVNIDIYPGARELRLREAASTHWVHEDLSRDCGRSRILDERKASCRQNFDDGGQLRFRDQEIEVAIVTGAHIAKSILGKCWPLEHDRRDPSL